MFKEINRRIDELGRIVIPMEARRQTGIHRCDTLTITVQDDGIMLRKTIPTCIFCGRDQDVIEYRHTHMCMDCFANISKMIDEKKADEKYPSLDECEDDFE